MYIDITKKIYDKMRTHQFVMSVMGTFDQELLRAFIKMTERKLESLEADDAIKRKIFHFVVECAQNLCNNDSKDENSKNNLFLIGKDKNNYIIHLGCVYSSTESIKIKEIIDSVNALETSEVRSTFYKVLASTEFARQNHFLMSILDLAKRTKDKICYEVFSIDDKSDFFSFNTTIAGATN
ncbi:MAG: DUF6272 family protein [Bacteroidia bacterium]